MAWITSVNLSWGPRAAYCFAIGSEFISLASVSGVVRRERDARPEPPQPSPAHRLEERLDLLLLGLELLVGLERLGHRLQQVGREVPATPQHLGSDADAL